MVQPREADADLPADVLPIFAGRAKLGGLRALEAIRLRDPDCGDERVGEREDQVARRHFPHRLVEWISRAVAVSLRRPQIAARLLLSECLVLVYPPVAHG